MSEHNRLRVFGVVAFSYIGVRLMYDSVTGNTPVHDALFGLFYLSLVTMLVYDYYLIKQRPEWDGQ